MTVRLRVEYTHENPQRKFPLSGDIYVPNSSAKMNICALTTKYRKLTDLEWQRKDSWCNHPGCQDVLRTLGIDHIEFRTIIKA